MMQARLEAVVFGAEDERDLLQLAPRMLLLLLLLLLTMKMKMMMMMTTTTTTMMMIAAMATQSCLQRGTLAPHWPAAAAAAAASATAYYPQFQRHIMQIHPKLLQFLHELLLTPPLTRSIGVSCAIPINPILPAKWSRFLIEVPLPPPAEFLGVPALKEQKGDWRLFRGCRDVVGQSHPVLPICCREEMRARAHGERGRARRGRGRGRSGA